MQTKADDCSRIVTATNCDVMEYLTVHWTIMRRPFNDGLLLCLVAMFDLAAVASERADATIVNGMQKLSYNDRCWTTSAIRQHCYGTKRPVP